MNHKRIKLKSLLYIILIFSSFYIISCDNTTTTTDEGICEDVDCGYGVCTIENGDTAYCLCDINYKNIDNRCIFKCSENSHPNKDNDDCDCDTNYHLENSSCVIDSMSCDDISCNSNEECKISNNIPKCVCVSGYHLEGESCVENSYSCSDLYETIFLQDLRGVDMLRELHDITGRGYHILSYDGEAKPLMFGTIDNEDGRVKGVYTGEYYDVDPGGMPNQNEFNCEHTWPKSLGAGSSPAKSDLHHLFPTFSIVNSARSSLPFGIVDDSSQECTSTDYLPNKRGGCKSFIGGEEGDVYISKQSNSVFEPADQHKGNVARAMFYFAVRYGNRGGRFLDSQQANFLRWNKDDPVNQKDLDRNEAIFQYQHNRNPFVDCPELLDRIDENTKFPENY